MKLLLDQNLSHRLCALLAHSFPSTAHVRGYGSQSAADEAIWAFAREHGYTIVSKDEDFHQRSFLYGHPPKVVWLRVGNCSTDQIAAILHRHEEGLRAFEADPEASFLILS